MDPLDQKLSLHFTVRELVFTNHRGIDNTPTPEVVANLSKLANNFLEPIRTQFGPLIINSGYRCPDLNKAVGGAADSAHTYGCAADMHTLDPQYSPRDVVSWIVNHSGLDYDQVIEEHVSTSYWCHLGILRPNHEAHARRMSLMYKGGVYTPWK